MGLQEQTIQKLQEFIGSERFNTIHTETQDKLIRTLDQQSSTGFTESKDPVFGSQQVIPESPVNPIDRLRLGLASPQGREELLKQQFGGTITGESGREVVATDRGFQSVNPQGFQLGDIPEFIPRIPGIAGQIAGSIGGAVIGTPAGQTLLGQSIGAGVGTAVGEVVPRLLGKALGLRPENEVSKEIVDSLKEGAKSGFLEFGFAKGLKVFPGVGKAFGKFFGGVGNILRKVGAVKKSTTEWLMQRVPKVGAKNIFTEAKSRLDYASRQLIPRIRDGVTNSLKNFTDDTAKLLGKLGVSDDAINSIQRNGIDDITQTQSRLGNSTAELSSNLQFTLSKNLDDAGTLFNQTLQSQPEGTLIKSNEFLNSIRRSLKQFGVMNADNSFRTVDPKNIPSTIKKVINIYNELVQGVVAPGKVRSTGKISISDYFRFKGLLDDAVSGTASLDRVVFEIKNGLTDDAVKSIKGLGDANQAFAKAKQLHDKFMPENKTGEKVLDRFNKMTAKQKADLIELDEQIPFLDDLKKLNAGREVSDLLDNQLSPAKLESMLSQAQSETKTVTRDLLTEIDGFLPSTNKFIDDYKDWLALLDLQDANVFASRGGIVKPAVESGANVFFKNILPVTSAIGKGAKAVAKPLSNVTKKVLEPQFGKFQVRTAPIVTRQQGRQQ